MGRRVSDLAVGRFCQTSANRLGIGRLVAVDGDTVSIRYTDLPFPKYQHTFEVPARSVKVGELPVETRAFVPLNGYWTAGRVQGRYRDQYRILLPNGLVADLDESEFEVRWSKPLDDPAAAVAEFVTGSAAFHQARHPFRVSLQKQRSVVRGYTGVSSAAIALYPHQVNAACRVLVDPVMRYLLADEVGLGKTIQAGIVIRQVLLDSPESCVVVAVPESLVRQWEKELDEKFFVDTLRPRASERTIVVPFEGISDAIAKNEPSLLVVDEAHRICGPGSDLYEITRSAASVVRSLLLLTATPYRGRPETFLRMLHLLDELAYPLDDVEGFERRIDERQQDAYALISLDPELPPAVLQPLVDDIVERHSYDQIVCDLAAKASAAMSDAGSYSDAIDDLKNHLSEANRISRRVIRTRRHSQSAHDFPVRGRTKKVVTVRRSTTVLVDSFLERLRDLYVDGVALSPFDEVVEGCLAGGPDLGVTLQLLGEESSHVSHVHALVTELQAELSLVDPLDFEWVVRPAREAVRSIGRKGVVACSSSENAEAVARALRTEFGSQAVVEHRGNMSMDSRDEAVETFTGIEDCRLLVIDESGEEGRNLQVADFVIHVDIPVSPNRIEQRIGRVDRFGFGKPVVNVILLDENSQYQRSLLSLMIDGIGVFDGSVATLQLPLARLETALRSDLVSAGHHAFERDVESLKAELDDQRQRVSELEEIESSEREVEFSVDAMHDLWEYEESWGEIEAAFDAFTAAGSGGVQIRRVSDPVNPNIFEYSVDPRLRTIPLMRMDRLDALARLLPARRSFSRMIALRNPGVRPVRLGDPMVDWLEKYLDLDDRGKAWVTWRQVPGLAEGDTLTFFRFDFALSFNEKELVGVLRDEDVTRRVRRRGDAFFPPRSETIWVHENRRVPEKVVREVLDPPEATVVSRRTDYNLSWKNWASIAERYPDWSRRVFKARSTALQLVRASDSLNEQITDAREQALGELDRRMSTLRTISNRPDRTSVQDHLRDEMDLHQRISNALLIGIEKPAIRLFAAGCVVVSSESPEES